MVRLYETISIDLSWFQTMFRIIIVSPQYMGRGKQNKANRKKRISFPTRGHQSPSGLRSKSAFPKQLHCAPKATIVLPSHDFGSRSNCGTQMDISQWFWKSLKVVIKSLNLQCIIFFGGGGYYLHYVITLSLILTYCMRPSHQIFLLNLNFPKVRNLKTLSKHIDMKS